MADLDSSAIAEPVDESLPNDEAAVDTDTDQESEAPSEAPSEDESTDASEPDNSDGSVESTPDDDDKPVITRRNAKQIAEQAVKDAFDAKQRADELERELSKQRQTEEALTAEMSAFVGSQDEIDTLRTQISQPIPVVDDAYDLDSVQAQQQAIRERNAAMDRLTEITKRAELLPKMLSRVKSSFVSTTYDVFDDIANSYDGVDREVWLGHLSKDGLSLDEFKSRLKAGFDHLYKAGQTVGANEWKGRYEAEKKAHNVTKAANGGPSQSPESGGRQSAGGSMTLDAFLALTPDARNELRRTPEGRAKIDAMTRGG